MIIIDMLDNYLKGVKMGKYLQYLNENKQFPKKVNKWYTLKYKPNHDIAYYFHNKDIIYNQNGIIGFIELNDANNALKIINKKWPNSNPKIIEETTTKNSYSLPLKEDDFDNFIDKYDGKYFVVWGYLIEDNRINSSYLVKANNIDEAKKKYIEYEGGEHRISKIEPIKKYAKDFGYEDSINYIKELNKSKDDVYMIEAGT
jgi:hypothetical protein